MKLSVFPSSIETSRALILRLVEIMNEEPDRVFNIAVSGGNTPALMFDLWANEYMEITPWDRKVLQSCTWQRSSFKSSADKAPLIAPAVATFINAGVSTTPCGVVKRALRALPSCFKI